MNVTRTRDLKTVSINVFIHLKGTSYGIVEKFKKLISANIVIPEDIKLITVNYNTSSGDVEEGPVRIYTSSGVEVLLNLTAGYPGSGPSDLCKILQLCEIDFDENDILSHRDTVNLMYNTDLTCVFKFITHDGTCVYSA